MPPPPAVAGPSTSTAAGPQLAIPLQQSPSEPTPPPQPRELPPPKRKICPEYIVDRLEQDWRRKRHAAIRNSCMKLQARFIPLVKRRSQFLNDEQLAEMTDELLLLRTASAGTRLVAAEQGNRIFRLTGLERPPEEKPKRFKLQRKERVDYQRIHLARNFDLTPSIVPKLAIERTPKERIMAMVKPHRSLLLPATPTTPPVISAVEPESNGREDDDSPDTPPLAATKGKRKVAQLLLSTLQATPIELKEKLEKKPKKDSTTKKRTSNRLSKTPRINTKEEEELTYCFCGRISFGEMVACDNEKCEIEWFHFECIGLTAKPKGKWFCPNCREQQESHKISKPGTVPSEPSTPKVGNFPVKDNDIKDDD